MNDFRRVLNRGFGRYFSSTGWVWAALGGRGQLHVSRVGIGRGHGLALPEGGIACPHTCDCFSYSLPVGDAVVFALLHFRHGVLRMRKDERKEERCFLAWLVVQVWGQNYRKDSNQIWHQPHPGARGYPRNTFWGWPNRGSIFLKSYKYLKFSLRSKTDFFFKFNNQSLGIFLYFSMVPNVRCPLFNSGRKKHC